MYLNHFGFNRRPFHAAADPDFFYAGGQYNHALTGVIHGLREQKGLFCVIGPSGCGKTALSNVLGKRLPPKTMILNFRHHQARPLDLLQATAARLGIKRRPGSPASLLNRIENRLISLNKSGGCFLLILDEAQSLNDAVLEEILQLSNLEGDGAKLAQILLLGRPPLKDLLTRAEQAALRQRVAFLAALRPLTSEATAEYMGQRLIAAGSAPELFAPDCAARVHDASRGIPRTINLLCDRALYHAYTAGGNLVEADHIGAAAGDVGLGPLQQAIFDVEAPAPLAAPLATPPDEASAIPPARAHPDRLTLWFRGAAVGLVLAIVVLMFAAGKPTPPTAEPPQAALTAPLAPFQLRQPIPEMVAPVPESAFAKPLAPRELAGAIPKMVASAPEPAARPWPPPNVFETESAGPAPAVSPAKKAPPDEAAWLAQNRLNDPRPYCLQLASVNTVEQARKAVEKWRKAGSNVYWVQYGPKAFAIMAGQFLDKDQARAYRKERDLSQGLIKKTPYAVLVGVYGALEEARAAFQGLLDQGESPYWRQVGPDRYWVLLGAYHTREYAEETVAARRAANLECRVVSR